MQVWNLFETMRLSANIALESLLLDAGDGSRWVMMIVVDEAKLKILLHGFRLTSDIEIGGALTIRPGARIDVLPF